MVSFSCRAVFLGVAVGLCSGFIAAILVWGGFACANQYFDYGMLWLAVDRLATTVAYGSFVGAANGGLAGLALGMFANPQSRTRERVEWVGTASLAALAPGLFLMNTSRFLFPEPFGLSFWLIHLGWFGASLGLAAWLSASLRRSEWRPSSAGLARLAGGFAIFAFAVSAGSWGSAELLRRPPADARSVILISVDTQRADHFGAYGYSRDTTPHLDELARSSQLFLQAYSHASVTSSSFTSILTGHRPRESGSYRNQRIQPKMNTVAEYLWNAGYETAAVVSNYVLRRKRNFEIGFDLYDDELDAREIVRDVAERVGANTTQAALKWLDAHGERPFFLWVHYQDPHGPYTPPDRLKNLYADEAHSGVTLGVNDTVSGDGAIPSYQALGDERDPAYYVSLYDAEIRHFDESLHELVEGVKGRGLWDDNLVILTSDHGEAMGEHDYYFAHGDHLYRDQLHIPLMLWAKEARAGSRSNVIVQHADILPTVLDFVGIEPATTLVGRNLFDPELRDAQVVSEVFVDDDYKCSLITRAGQLLYESHGEKFWSFDGVDVESRAGRELVATMESLCAIENLPDMEPAALSAAEHEALKALGYAD